MMIRFLLITMITISTAGALAETPATQFFAFDNGVGRGEWTPEQQATCLKELGYAGIGYSGHDEIHTRLDTFKKHNLTVFSIYVACYVDKEEAFAPGLAEAIKQLKDTQVVLWLTVQGKAKSDQPAVKAVQQLADLAAASNLKIVLYPHHGLYVGTLDDAMRITKQVDRDNVGVSFNLCHELKAGNEARFDKLLEEALPRLWLVSINGADHSGNWDTLIQPLDIGEYDVCALLKRLNILGYTGPIGLQCYNVPGDIRTNLDRSITQWNIFQEQLGKADR